MSDERALKLAREDQCDNCAHFHKGYRLQGFRVPSSCNRHFHTVSGDDPACNEHLSDAGGENV